MGLDLVPFGWHPQNGKADMLHAAFKAAFGRFELIMHRDQGTYLHGRDVANTAVI